MCFWYNQKHEKKKINSTFFFLKKLLLCNVSYIELFTRKILMFTVECFFVLMELLPTPV